MPTRKLSDERRRALTLAAISGESPSKLAQEYSVARSYVYLLKEEATRDAEAEGAFWDEVRGMKEEE